MVSRLPRSASPCVGQQALYPGLKELEADISHHIHMENDILYSRVLEQFKS
jgi:iron-sulfur cluster repair protein YtfE (RIC family)